MSIIVVGSTKNTFLPLDNCRQKFLVDVNHPMDNIDHENQYYCELTGLYYLWKHNTDDIVGLEHYRRYLTINNKTPINQHEINDQLNHCDVICNSYIYKNRPVLMNHSHKLVWILKYLTFCDALLGTHVYAYTKFATEYVHGHELIVGNIFISHASFMNEYCSFLFPTLDLFIKAELHCHRELAPRIIGYISEYLFGAYLRYHKKKLAFCNILRVS